VSRQTIALWCISVFIAGAGTAFSTSAQETPPVSQANNSMQESMKLMMPGDGHRTFSTMTGKWVGTLRIWNPAAPTSAPMESPTESESRLVLGGRFVVEEATGSIARMPMQRMSILGYDNLTKRYTLVFYSSMETTTNIATGTLDAEGKVLTLRGEFEDAQGKHPFKNVIRMESDDVHIFESYKIMPDGTELKAFEQVSRRSK
jgi:hypothetical protein